MSNSKSRNVLAIAAATVATGVLAYLVYFDYKRRNDSQFRKKLRKYTTHRQGRARCSCLFPVGKEKKRVNKTVAEEKSASVDAAPNTEMLREALEQIKHELVPITSEEKETYFMSQVSTGEQLAAQGAFLFVLSTCESKLPLTSHAQVHLSTCPPPLHSTRLSVFTPHQ
jgi:import receptor subunit TOM20